MNLDFNLNSLMQLVSTVLKGAEVVFQGLTGHNKCLRVIRRPMENHHSKGVMRSSVCSRKWVVAVAFCIKYIKRK